MKTTKHLSIAVLAGTIVFAVPPAGAQPSTISYREIGSVGTPDEMPLVRAVSARLRARFTGDAAFAKQVADAFAQNKQSEAIKLIAQVVQVPDAEILAVEEKRTSRATNTVGTVHLAAGAREISWSVTRQNPWYTSFMVNGWWVCIGSKAACFAVLRAAGYKV